MKSFSHRIYRNHRPVSVVLAVIAAVLLAAIIICACLFFGFKKYIVYTPEGLRVEVPWLEEAPAESGDILP